MENQGDASRDGTKERIPVLRFHGVTLDAIDYEKIRRLATVLYGEIDVRVEDEVAWRSATIRALHVLTEWRASDLVEAKPTREARTQKGG